jgi:hypothetical protein
MSQKFALKVVENIDSEYADLFGPFVSGTAAGLAHMLSKTFLTHHDPLVMIVVALKKQAPDLTHAEIQFISLAMMLESLIDTRLYSGQGLTTRMEQTLDKLYATIKWPDERKTHLTDKFGVYKDETTKSPPETNLPEEGSKPT